MMVRVTSPPHICQGITVAEAPLPVQTYSSRYAAYSHVTLRKSLHLSSHWAIVCPAVHAS